MQTMDRSAAARIEDEHVAALRSRVVSALGAYHSAIDKMTDRLEFDQRSKGRVEELLAEATPMLDIARLMDPAARRQAMDVAEDRVRKARHDLRRTMFLLAEAEGSSLTEIARAWQVSRQLVSRMTREIG